MIGPPIGRWDYRVCGLVIEIFTQDSEVPLDVFNASVGYKLLENSIDVEGKKSDIINDFVL